MIAGLVPQPDRSSKRAKRMDSLSFLERAAKAKVQPLYVLHGDEAFLKRQVLAALRPLVLGEANHDFATTSYPGDKAEWATVHDELETPPFLAPRRLEITENAAPLVPQYGRVLEKYVGLPAASGVLVLELGSWPANTRLARLVPESGTISCKTQTRARLPEWCTSWSAN